MMKLLMMMMMMMMMMMLMEDEMEDKIILLIPKVFVKIVSIIEIIIKKQQARINYNNGNSLNE